MRVLEFLIASALLVVSFWLMALAFLPEFVGYELVTFLGGILVLTVSFWLPTRRFAKA